IIDADNKAFKKVFAPVIAEDIFGANSFKAVEDTSGKLEKLGYHTKVHAREINFFYLTDEFRERIVRTEDGRFEVLHRELYFSEEELRTETEHYPERFSPNVVMRSEEHTSVLQSRENLVC